MPDELDPYRDTFRALAHVANNLARLEPIAATALRNLHHDANIHDSFPTTASGRLTDPHGKAELTSVEAAARNRLGDNGDGPTAQAWSLLDYVITARDALNHAIRICEANTRGFVHLSPTERRALRCLGDELDPEPCPDMATIEGRCERHHLAHQQHTRAEQRARWATERRQRRHR